MATHLKTWNTYYIGSNGSNPKTNSGDTRGRIYVYLESQDIANNTSLIRIDQGVYASVKTGVDERLDNFKTQYRANNGSYGGEYKSFSKSSWRFAYDGTFRKVGTSYHTVQHNEDGTCQLYVNGSISGSSAWYTSFTRNSSFNMALPQIPRGTTITSFTVNKNGLTALTVNWATAHNIDRVQYKIGSGAWTNGETSIDKASGSFNITGLSPNTAYSITIRVRRKDSQVESDSSAKSQTTYDIARITSTNPSNNIEMGDSLSVAFTNPSGAAMQVGIYSSTFPQVTIAAYRDYAGASPYTFILTQEEKDVMYDLALSNPTQYFGIYVNNLNNTYRNAVTRTFKITENASSKPIFNAWTYKDTNAKTVALTGNNQKVIKGYSNVEATISSANKMVTQKKANPSHYTFTIGGKTVTIPYDTTERKATINNANNIVMSMVASDSRGFTTAITKNLGANLIEYNKPVVTSATIKRDNDVEAASKLTVSGTWCNCNFGEESNDLTTHYRLKKTSDDWDNQTWNSINLTKSSNNFSYDAYIHGDLGANGFTIDDSFDIQIRIVDKLETVIYNLYLSSGKPAIAIHPNGVAFGAPYDENLGGEIQIAGKGYYNGVEIGGGISVVDNLTSTSTTDALSAKQGKVLNDKINLKSNLISVRPGSNFALTTSNTYEKIPFPHITGVVGDKLTVDDGEILVGSGVSRIKVSAGTTVMATTKGTKYLELNKNNTQFFVAYSTAATDGSVVNLNISNVLVPVGEGDKVSLSGRGQSGDIYYRYQTNLTIEVVE